MKVFPNILKSSVLKCWPTEDEYGGNKVYMYVNAKMISIETVPRIRGEGMKESSKGGEFKYDIIDIL
jgi:hypothetical protein